MLITAIKRIIANYRNSISLDQLEEELLERNHSIRINDLIKQSKFFHLSNGIVFLKSALLESKKTFLLEFDDYIKSKVFDQTLKNNITALINMFTPEIFYSEWIDLDLESKILVFDLLFCFFLKPTKTKEKIKIFFNHLIELYSLLVIISFIILNENENEVEKTTDYIKKIEPLEEMLKKQLYNILCSPYSFSQRLPSWEKELTDAEDFLNNTIQKTFSPSLNYSDTLLRRVIENKLRHFELLSLLSRYENSSLYEWLLILSDKDNQSPHKEPAE